jgi:diguanylate cyclase (GGDEF)-like protein/PAS domain S-box-containing protein
MRCSREAVTFIFMGMAIGDSAAPQPDERWPFHVLAEAIKDPVVIWSPWRDDTGDIVDFVYEFVNEAAVQTIGIPAAELLGQRLLEILPVHRELGLFDKYRDVALTGKADLIEIPWFQDGNVAGAFEVSISVIGDGIVSVARDVTERLDAEAKASRSAAIHQYLAENTSELLVRLTAERTQRLVMDTLGEGVVLQSEEEGVLRANHAASELLGLIEAPEVTLEQISTIADIYEADGSPLDFDDTPAKRARRSGRAEQGRLLQLRMPDGSHRWIQVNAVVVGNEDDTDGDAIKDLDAPPRPVRVLSTMIDLTDRVVAERRVDQERQLLHATFDSVHAGLLAVDADGIIIEVNQHFRDLARGPHQIGQKLADLTYDYSICDERGVPFEPHQRPIERALAGETVTDVTSVLRWRDGDELVVLVSASPIYAADNNVGAVLTMQAVTALRSAEAELRKMATIDHLTGLPNRRALIAHLDDAIERQSAANDQLAVLFLDLDGFKSVNDTLGHEAGDELLRAVAQRLTTMIRSGDLIGRIGGDEFVAVLERLSPQDTDDLAARIEAEISRPFLLAAGTANIGVSIGRAVHTTSLTARTLIAAADVEMYLTKHERSGRRPD